MSFPNNIFWTQLLVTVGVEVCCLAALGFVAQRLLRPAAWQRAVWQLTVICLLLSPASEWTGFGRGAAGFLFGHKRAAESAPAVGFTVVRSEGADGPAAAFIKGPVAASRPPVWWPGWIWLAGATVVLGRMAAAQILLLALRLRRGRIANCSLRERVARVARSVGLRRTVVLFRMPQSISPMAFGILRPGIGLPPEFESKFSAAEQEAVLAHELAHLAAMDPLWFLLADLATALLWWHPLAWWARRSLHGAAELAADEATALLPDGPGALAKCLVSLGKEMTAAHGWGWVGINGGFRSTLGKRVERLTRMSGGARRPLGGWMGAAAMIAAAILIVPAIVLLFGALQSARGQQEDGWRGQLRASWNTSPGALLLLAAADDTEKEKLQIATPPLSNDTSSILQSNDMGKQKLTIAVRVQNAKLLYEMGKYDEAEAILVQVWKEDPSNRTAPYYLDMIKEARYLHQARKQVDKPVPAPQDDPSVLYSKVFKVDVRAIGQALKEFYRTNLDSDISSDDVNDSSLDFGNNASGGPQVPTNYVTTVPGLLTTHNLLRRYFAAAGANLNEAGNILGFNDRLGQIIVRATAQDLEIIQGAIETLNQVPPQVLIETKFVELSQEDSRGFGVNLFLGSTLTNNAASGSQGGTAPSFQGPGATANPSGMFPASGIPTPGTTTSTPGRGANASSASNNLIASGLRNTNGLGMQEMLVKNWIGILPDPQFRLVINAIEHQTGADILSAPGVTTLSGRQTHISSTNASGDGPSLNVLAKVSADGYSIHITAMPSIKAGSQIWHASARQNIWDGQTLVIGEVITNQPPGVNKVRVVFVTVTIIDPAGNRVHTDADMPFAKSSAPPQ